MSLPCTPHYFALAREAPPLPRLSLQSNERSQEADQANRRGADADNLTGVLGLSALRASCSCAGLVAARGGGAIAITTVTTVAIAIAVTAARAAGTGTARRAGAGNAGGAEVVLANAVLDASAVLVDVGLGAVTLGAVADAFVGGVDLGVVGEGDLLVSRQHRHEVRAKRGMATYRHALGLAVHIAGGAGIEALEDGGLEGSLGGVDVGLRVGGCLSRRLGLGGRDGGKGAEDDDGETHLELYAVEDYVGGDLERECRSEGKKKLTSF
jgi:hypothetical protein